LKNFLIHQKVLKFNCFAVKKRWIDLPLSHSQPKIAKSNNNYLKNLKQQLFIVATTKPFPTGFAHFES
jgi:hypothetical protein